MNSRENSVYHVTSNGSCRKLLELLTEIMIGLLTIFLVSIFLLLSFPVYLFRFTISVYAFYFRKDLGDILNGISAHIAHDYFDNKTPRATIVLQIIIRGYVTLDELKTVVKSQWVQTNDNRFQHFCEYPVRWMGFTFYKKAAASFNIDNHIHLYPKLEQRIGEKYVSEEDLITYSQELLNSPYTPFISPWEVHLIQNYRNDKICLEAEQLSVLVFKFHHSLIDGFGMMSAFRQAFSKQVLADLKIPKPRQRKRSFWQKLKRCIILSGKLVTEAGHYVFQSMGSNPWKVLDQNKEWQQLSFESKMIPIEKFHKIKNAFGVSFSSVLYSTVYAALYNSNRIGRKEIFDNSIYCSQIIPLPNHPMSLTNHFNSSFFDLPICKYDNPAQRLRATNIILRAGIEKSWVPIVLPWAAYIFGCHVYPISKFMSRNRAIPVGVTNVPLDPLEFEINGKKAVAAGCITGAFDGVCGIDVVCLSLGKYISLSVTAEKALMKRDDINLFGKHMIDEIEKLFMMANLDTK